MLGLSPLGIQHRVHEEVDPDSSSWTSEAFEDAIGNLGRGVKKIFNQPDTVMIEEHFLHQPKHHSFPPQTGDNMWSPSRKKQGRKEDLGLQNAVLKGQVQQLQAKMAEMEMCLQGFALAVPRW